MKRGDQGDDVARGLLEAQVGGGHVLRRRRADDREDDAVPELVRQDVEVERERMFAIVLVDAEPGLDETVAGLRVVPVEMRDQLEPGVVVGEVPVDRTPEIVLPDVENEADGAVHVGGVELARAHFEVIEMAVRSGRTGACTGPVNGGR